MNQRCIPKLWTGIFATKFALNRGGIIVHQDLALNVFQLPSVLALMLGACIVVTICIYFLFVHKCVHT